MSAGARHQEGRYGWRGNGAGVEIYDRRTGGTIRTMDTQRHGVLAARWAAQRWCEGANALRGAARERVVRKEE